MLIVYPKAVVPSTLFSKHRPRPIHIAHHPPCSMITHPHPLCIAARSAATRRFPPLSLCTWPLIAVLSSHRTPRGPTGLLSSCIFPAVLPKRPFFSATEKKVDKTDQNAYNIIVVRRHSQTTRRVVRAVEGAALEIRFFRYAAATKLNMERYRSGHNGADSKSFQHLSVSSPRKPLLIPGFQNFKSNIF